jgi:hypothetical protein
VTITLKNRIGKIEAATKDLIPQEGLSKEEKYSFTRWCYKRGDNDSICMFLSFGDKAMREFCARTLKIKELRQLFGLLANKPLESSDEDFLSGADEQTKRALLRYKAEVDEWRSLLAKLKPMTLAEQLKSSDRETRALARHFNRQLAEFRAEQNS